MMTPFEKLKSMAQVDDYLKTGVSIEQLEVFSYEMTDNEASEQLNVARSKLFKTIQEQTQAKA